MEFLKLHQLNIMLFMSGICGILVVLTLMTRTLSVKRRRILALLEAAAMFLLIFDRYAYLYRGNPGRTGFWMVRISNFLVYFLTLFIAHSLTLYLFELYRNDGKLSAMPKRLYVCEGMYAVSTGLLIISQFTGLYYYFDETNTYHRARWNLLCYVMPLLIGLLQLSVVLQYRKLLSRVIYVSLILNIVAPLGASIIQFKSYGVSLTNITVVGLAIVLYMFALIDLNDTVERAKIKEIEFYKEEQKREHELFEETAEALTSAIDAKDKYTHGHSGRVADYSLKIAREAGKSEEECEKVYFAALLHDVGKIGISDSIINKDGKLTEEEYSQIKLHPVYGNQILSRIQQSPYLSIGAHYHHERFDGRGYPDGLKGEDIPEIARIIAVADAYDAMTSIRSYRDPIPQDKVREEFVKGMGTQFDPQFATIMLHLIDLDTEYRMKEQEAGADISLKTNLHCEDFGKERTGGISITEQITRIRLYATADEGFAGKGIPSLVIFDSLDGRIHDSEEKKKDLLYLEYGKLRFDGQTVCEAARKMETSLLTEKGTVLRNGTDVESAGNGAKQVVRYDIEAMRYGDHMMIRVTENEQIRQTIIALPDSSRFSYLSITGEHCRIWDISVSPGEDKITSNTIPRIAEEISYIRDCPEGNIPNIQIDRWRSAATQGVLIKEGLKLKFHARSLPTARLIWHCPFVCIFTSKNGKVDGEGFREFILIRLDGENWESDQQVENKVVINHNAAFTGWNQWKEQMQAGIDCEVSIHIEGNQVIVLTENLGISIRSVTTIHDKVQDIYVALTGDQCAITNIWASEDKQTDI